jgi:hypothetical protein
MRWKECAYAICIAAQLAIGSPVYGQNLPTAADPSGKSGPTHVITHARLERSWDPADPRQIATFFPERAARMGVSSGRALLRCTVNADRKLQDCSVLSEQPPGWKFGDQALLAARNFVLAPLDGDGRSVIGGELTFMIPFEQAAEPADQGRTVEDNIEFAVNRFCAPFVLDHEAEETLPTHEAFVHRDIVDVVGNIVPEDFRIGAARVCDVGARGVDPQLARRAALAALAESAEAFVPAKSRYYPGRFATEDMLCASPASRRPGANVLLSANHPEAQAGVAILLTISDDGHRGPQCDRDDAEMNYRRLIKPNE